MRAEGAPPTHQPTRPRPPRRLTLRTQLLLAMALSVGLPVATAVLVGGSLIWRRDALGAERGLTNIAVAVARQVDAHLERHLDAVRALASAVPTRPIESSAALDELLERTHEVYPAFRSMLIANDRGMLVMGHPRVASDGKPLPLPRPVGDRDYYRQPMETGRPYVSGVFRGRGFGTDPIVAVSAPVLSSGRPVGVVEGSLDLTRLSHVEGLSGQALFDVIIVDARDAVVFASARTGYAPLQELAQEPAGRALHEQPGALLRYRAGGTAYLAARVATRMGGWHVLVQHREADATAATSRFLWTMGATLLGGMGLSLLLALALARSATRPVAALERHVGQVLAGRRPEPLEVSPRAPREVAELVAGYQEMERRLGRTLSGLLPVCAWCKRIRDDGGGWQPLERYVQERTSAAFTHGMCEDCARRLEEEERRS